MICPCHKGRPKRIVACLLIFLALMPQSGWASPCDALVSQIVSQRFASIEREIPFKYREDVEKALEDMRQGVEQIILKQCKIPADCTPEKLDPILTNAVEAALKNSHPGFNWRPLAFFAVGVGLLLTPLIAAWGVETLTTFENKAFLAKLTATLVTLSIAEIARSVFTVALKPVQNRLEQWGYRIRTSRSLSSRANTDFEAIFARALESYSEFGRQGRSVKMNHACYHNLKQIIGLENLKVIHQLSVEDGNPIPLKTLLLTEFPNQVAKTVRDLHEAYDEVSLSSLEVVGEFYEGFTAAHLRNGTLSPADLDRIRHEASRILSEKFYPRSSTGMRHYFDEVLDHWFNTNPPIPANGTVR